MRATKEEFPLSSLEQAAATITGDYPLTERLLPFHGRLRTDLRDLPVVILPGATFKPVTSMDADMGAFVISFQLL